MRISATFFAPRGYPHCRNSLPDSWTRKGHFMAERSRSKPKLSKAEIKTGFADATIDLRLDQIIPLKTVSASALKSPKYSQIVASIREVGIIEPPVVSRDAQSRGRYILLDGHLRLEALKELGEM